MSDLTERATADGGPPPAARPPAWRTALRWALRLLGLAAGVTLLVSMIRTAGPTRILHSLQDLGGWSVLIVGVSATWFLLNTWGWQRAFEGQRPGFLRLLQAHLMAETVSNITPFLALGGEPLKVLLLHRRVGTSSVVASVLNDNVVHVISAVLFMLLGLLCGGLLFEMDGALLGVLVAAIAIFGGLTFLLVRGMQAGLLARVAGWILRLPLPIPGGRERWVERAAAVDSQVGGFLRSRRKDFLLCLVGHLAGRLMGAVEAWVILAALGHPVSFGTAVFIIAVVHVLVNLLFSIIPSQLGIQEAAAYLLFELIGLDPAVAVVLALVRRIRGFFWIGVGLALLAIVRPRRAARSDAASDPTPTPAAE